MWGLPISNLQTANQVALLGTGKQTFGRTTVQFSSSVLQPQILQQEKPLPSTHGPSEDHMYPEKTQICSDSSRKWSCHSNEQARCKLRLGGQQYLSLCNFVFPEVKIFQFVICPELSVTRSYYGMEHVPFCWGQLPTQEVHREICHL